MYPVLNNLNQCEPAPFVVDQTVVDTFNAKALEMANTGIVQHADFQDLEFELVAKAGEVALLENKTSIANSKNTAIQSQSNFIENLSSNNPDITSLQGQSQALIGIKSDSNNALDTLNNNLNSAQNNLHYDPEIYPFYKSHTGVDSDISEAFALDVKGAWQSKTRRFSVIFAVLGVLGLGYVVTSVASSKDDIYAIGWCVLAHVF